MNSEENFLADELERYQTALALKARQLQDAHATIDLLDQVVHKAARIAGHLPFLCAEMPEVSNELVQAALQLQSILVQRKV